MEANIFITIVSISHLQVTLKSILRRLKVLMTRLGYKFQKTTGNETTYRLLVMKLHIDYW